MMMMHGEGNGIVIPGRRFIYRTSCHECNEVFKGPVAGRAAVIDRVPVPCSVPCKADVGAIRWFDVNALVSFRHGFGHIPKGLHAATA